MSVKYFTDPRAIPDRGVQFKYTVVLDVDETLVHRDTSGTIYMRPHAQKLISVILSLGDVELLIWSAGKEVHVDACLKLFKLDETLAVVRGDKREWDIKDMSLISRSNRKFNTIIMIDDREDTITASIHFHVNEWRNMDAADVELDDVLQNILSYVMVSTTQCRVCSDLGPFGSRNRVAQKGIYG